MKIPDDSERFLALIQAMAATFRVECDEALFEGYRMALDDLPIEAIELGVRRGLRECKFMPSGSELRELAGAVQVKTESRALVAYATACKAVQKHGAYASVDFDDPLANAVVRDMGGWERFCDWSLSEVQWRQRDFLNLYAARTQSGVSAELAAPLVGLCESENLQTGFPNQLSDTPRRIACGLPSQRPGLISGSPQKRIAGSAGQKLIAENVRVRPAEPVFRKSEDWIEQKPLPRDKPPDAETLVRPDLSSEEFEALKQKLTQRLKELAECEDTERVVDESRAVEATDENVLEWALAIAGCPAQPTQERSAKR